MKTNLEENLQSPHKNLARFTERESGTDDKKTRMILLTITIRKIDTGGVKA